MRIIGIDPGFTGGVAAMDVPEPAAPPTSVRVYDAPTMAGGVMRRGEARERPVLSPRRMLWILRQEAEGGPCVAALERVGPRPLEGVAQTFRFGEGYGMWQMALAAVGITYYLVAPSEWKRALKLTGAGKDEAVILAEQMFPAVEFRTPRGRLLDGRAEALLLANHLRLKIAQGKA